LRFLTAFAFPFLAFVVNFNKKRKNTEKTSKKWKKGVDKRDMV